MFVSASSASRTTKNQHHQSLIMFVSASSKQENQHHESLWIASYLIAIRLVDVLIICLTATTIVKMSWFLPITPPLTRPIVAYLSFFFTLHNSVIPIDCCVICVAAYWPKQSAKRKIILFVGVSYDADGDSEAVGWLLYAFAPVSSRLLCDK